MNVHNKPCRICEEIFLSNKERDQHEKRCRQQIRTAHFKEDFQSSFERESAINNRFNIFTIEPTNNIDYSLSIKINLETVKNTLLELLQNYSSMKFYTIFEALLRKEIHGDTQEFGFYSNTMILLQNSDIDEILQTCEQKINTSIENFLKRGSGWIWEKFINISLNVTEYRPCSGGTYLELPKSLMNKKKSILNIKSNDDKCVIWSIISALHPCKSNATHASSYRQHFYDIDLSGVSFPTPISDIPKLEKNNHIRINVYGYACDPSKPNDKVLNAGIFPCYISPFNYDKTVHLLLITNEYKQHYVLIKSLDNLVRNKDRNRSKHCERCLQGFTLEYSLNQHMIDCKEFRIQRTVMPDEENIEFKNYKNQLEYPVIIVADTESILVPKQENKDGDNCSKTTIINEHEPSGYAYKVISNTLPHLNKTVKVKRHEGCMDTFISDLYSEYEIIKHIFDKPKPMEFTREDLEKYKNSTHCHICGGKLEWMNVDNYTVRDHCHFTGNS